MFSSKCVILGRLNIAGHATAYNLQRICKMEIKVISSRIYMIGSNESKLSWRKSTQMRLNKSKESLNNPNKLK